MAKRTRDRDMTPLLHRLRELTIDPTAQHTYALDLLGERPNTQVVLAALAVLQAQAEFDDRGTLLSLYAWYDVDGVRRDAGGYVRSTALRVLRPILTPADLPLLEHAATTYEYLPPRSEAAFTIRAAALRGLDHVDPALAGFHATRLFFEAHTSPIAGEPALTAVDVLRSRGTLLPLYALVVSDQPALPDVVGECLRSLAEVPASILADVVARHRATPHEIVRFGVYDLILAHDDWATYRPWLRDELQRTTELNAYRYLATSIVASRKPPLLADLATLAADEQHDAKRTILREMAALLGLHPAGTDLCAALDADIQPEASGKGRA